MKLATAAQMRQLDEMAIRERGIPSLDLMERAAEHVAAAALDILSSRSGKSRAAVFCGSGNNGGDGIAAARLLFLKGVQVRVFLVGEYEKLTADALTQTQRLSDCGVELERYDEKSGEQSRWARESHVVIDAVFGVGLSREIAPESRQGAAIALMNRCAAPVVAADISSGVDASTGRVLGCAVRADRTVTFTLAKVGQMVGDGAVYSGEVTVADIGIPADLVRSVRCPVQTVERRFAADALPQRRVDGHKGTFGKVLIVGGAVGYTGAPYLAAAAAVRSGCGLVFLGVPASIWAVEAAKCVSAMPFPLPEEETRTGGAAVLAPEEALRVSEEKLAGCDVLALGPGLGRTPQAQTLVLALLERTEKPVVLDADGINALEGHIDALEQRRGRVTILTPHDGEFARIGGEMGDRVGAARAFAARWGCVLVLKGHRTVIAAPEGAVLVNTTGHSGLAKGGSGDVLTGLIASLLAQGTSPVQAAALGVWLHGRAGDLAEARLTAYGVTPADVVGAVPEVFRELME